jgi:NADH-quinone oxidoreductase subunit M
MVNHGITTGALFVLVGILDERAHTRELNAFGGLWGKVPAFSFFFLLFSLASLGLPGLNNFVGEFLILAGVFRVSPAFAGLAFAGIVVTLVYTLRLVQQVLFVREQTPLEIADISFREALVLVTLSGIAIYLGVHPAPLLDLVHGPVELLIAGTGGTP